MSGEIMSQMMSQMPPMMMGQNEADELRRESSLPTDKGILQNIVELSDQEADCTCITAQPEATPQILPARRAKRKKGDGYHAIGASGASRMPASFRAKPSLDSIWTPVRHSRTQKSR